MKGYTTTGVFFRVAFSYNRKLLKQQREIKKPKIRECEFISLAAVRRYFLVNRTKSKRRISMIKINGKLIEADTITLYDYLKENDYVTNRIAVECNEEIVPKSQYETFILHSGDVVEIVSFVGGG